MENRETEPGEQCFDLSSSAIGGVSREIVMKIKNLLYTVCSQSSNKVHV